MILVIESYRSLSSVRIARNIYRKEFVNLLRTVDQLVAKNIIY